MEAAKIGNEMVKGVNAPNIQYHRVHDHPVATLLTAAGDQVHMTVLKGSYDERSFREQIEKLSFQKKEKLYDFGGIVFPMISVEGAIGRFNLSWLREMETFTSCGKRAWIEQALDQVKIGLDHLGMRVEATTAAEFGQEIAMLVRDPLIINDDVAVWVVRPGAPDLLSANYFPDRAVWKQPASTQKSTAAPETIDTTGYEVRDVAQLATPEPYMLHAHDGGTEEIFRGKTPID